jgi:putative ABC transport system substrate-binding protein
MRRREFIAMFGAAAAWPLVALAQQSAMPVIGFMSAREPEESKHLVSAFRRGLADGGFVEGENVAIEFRWAYGQYDRLPALAADLVNRRVSVIAAVGGEPSALAAKAATSTIPIVFGIGSDPIGLGLVDSLTHPSGNVTGATLMTAVLEQKRFGLLRELAPGVAIVGVLVDENFAPAARQLQQIEEAARATNQRIAIAKASTRAALEAAFATLTKEHVGALLVAAAPFFDVERDRIISFAARQRLPAVYQFREYAMAGGLLSYGVVITETYRQYGVYAAAILKGARPVDLPIMQPSKFELVINLKTAKAFGVDIPASILAQADEVIE